MTKYLTTIGLEFHAELKTRTKIFCSCPIEAGAEPNTHVCPVCLGLPGVLPVLNRRVVELAVKAGLALNCEISRFSKFDRKNYFYPDLPKGYQVTQFPLPICRNGYVTIRDAEGAPKRVRINRIHMEEDAGKLVHSGDNLSGSTYSMPDYNRAAVPLVEIVTEPDLSSAEEARDFGETLRLRLLYAGVSDVRMERGSLRCDVNISLRPEDQEELGVKVELKNLNSFRAVYRAIKFEEERQSLLLERGLPVVQETRLWDEASGETRSMRSKEDAHDYRYFPEPDLVPVVIDEQWLAAISDEMPELPEARTARLLDLGLGEKETAQIVAEPRLSRFFDDAVARGGEAKTVSHWLLGDISRLLNESETESEEVPVDADQFACLLEQVERKAINLNSARTVLEELFGTDKKTADIIAAHGFAQISDTSALQEAVDQVIAANPKPVADYRGGKKASIGFLVGQVMKATHGQANAALVRELLEKALEQ
ncbi:MAG: Asp-tRNA(Asn)/Glu-tRNA(Gln) amidotransferase subunit GatB [Firmicutes bacterium]|nr:Asp-tRNA(Asn)/Glu-tRNA(Gln) amidotransferase subunit GatB [Bacillota bacterium]